MYLLIGLVVVGVFILIRWYEGTEEIEMLRREYINLKGSYDHLREKHNDVLADVRRLREELKEARRE